MKKLLFIGTLLLVIAACSGTSKNVPKEEETMGTLINRGNEKNPVYYMTLEAENGDKTKKRVEFFIDGKIVKELKLSEAKILNICDEAILYADWNVNFKPTYKHSESASLSYDKKEKKITAYMDGTAENAYGVPDNISSYISFNPKGILVLDADGLPEIY